MAQINDVILIRFGGCTEPVNATVIGIDGSNEPTRVIREDNVELSSDEFTIWVPPVSPPNPRARIQSQSLFST